MSDIIIGSIIALVGVLVGSAITGYISYRNTKLTLRQQEKESRRNRLLEIRKCYLVPLRETVSKWVVELTRMIQRIESIACDLQRHGEVGQAHK